MTIPLWCLLVGVVLPFIWFGAGASARKEQFGALDNNHPRLQQAKCEGKAARANAAHLNAFEALILFAPAVLVAHVTQANATQSMALAVAWVVFRVGHGVAYIANMAGLRGAMFGLGMLAMLGQFIISALPR